MTSIDTPGPYEGDLSRLMRVIRGSITLFGLILVAIVAFAGWSTNRAATDIERAQVENAINLSISSVLDGLKSVAWWDEAVTSFGGRTVNYEFADLEFGLFLTETYGNDEVYVLDEADRPIYTYKEGARAGLDAYELRRKELAPVIAEVRGRKGEAILKARPDEFGRTQSDYRVFTQAEESARWAGHIMTIGGRPAVVSAITIIPNVDMTLLKGTPKLLAVVVYIKDEFISKIARSILLTDLKLAPEPIAKSGVLSEAFVGDDGIPAGYLSWTTRRPGHVLLTLILPLVACGVLGAGIISNQMFHRLRRASEQLAEREAKSRHASRHDALSGLPNRMHMLEKADEWLQSGSLSVNGRRAIAAYVDIDQFKDINDTLGHETGDKLVRAVAERLRARLKSTDFVARFGGDEFTILCLADNEEGGRRLAERVSGAFDDPFSIDGQKMNVKASVGMAMAPDHGTTTDELMRHADIALYDAKRRGRNQVVDFTEEMARDVEDRRAIEVDLRTAIERGELRLRYQPIVSCESGEILGAEALLRWRHPLRGEIPPSTFIPIAENSGLMPALGTWMLERAVKDSKRWPELEMSVNLSPVQFRQTDLLATLEALFAKHQVPPDRFVLEITEGVLLEATAATTSTLNALGEMGFQTALDDFGTGYSSLVYLSHFKFNKIKIDRGFVANATHSDTSRAIVQSVASLGRALGMEIVAEGVETEYQAQMMSLFGCTELQGYLFSKPVEVDQLSRLIEQHTSWRRHTSLLEPGDRPRKASA